VHVKKMTASRLRALEKPLRLGDMTFASLHWDFFSDAQHEFFDGGPDGVLAMNLKVPFSSVLFMVHEGGMIEAACHVFRLFRLQNVRQLGFIKDPSGANRSTEGGAYGHRRYEHVLSVAAISTLIAHNLDLSFSQRNTLILAAVTHDALTAAGGDTMKLVDKEAFDEDQNYPELLVGEGWERLKRTYGINEELLVAIVQSKSPLSTLLDIADKLVYSGCDVRGLFLRLQDSRSEDALQVASTALWDPRVCDVWEHVRQVKGRFVIADPDALVRFLHMRVRMFKDVYFNPLTRFREFFFGKIILTYMYERGMLTRDWLMRASDTMLVEEIARFMGQRHAYGDVANLIEEEETVDTFHTLAEARAHAVGLGIEHGRAVFLDHFRGKIKPGMDMLVYEGRKIRTLKEARPDKARRLEELAEIENRFWVYSFEEDPLWNDNVKQAIEAYQAAEATRA
jgi:hypothetical protein